MGHRAAVNVVDFDDRYIVSASGDRTIKVSRERERGGGGKREGRKKRLFMFHFVFF